MASMNNEDCRNAWRKSPSIFSGFSKKGNGPIEVDAQTLEVVKYLLVGQRVDRGLHLPIEGMLVAHPITTVQGRISQRVTRPFCTYGSACTNASTVA